MNPRPSGPRPDALAMLSYTPLGGYGRAARPPPTRPAKCVMFIESREVEAQARIELATPGYEPSEMTTSPPRRRDIAHGRRLCNSIAHEHGSTYDRSRVVQRQDAGPWNRRREFDTRPAYRPRYDQPRELAFGLVRLPARIAGFQPAERGSTPLRAAIWPHRSMVGREIVYLATAVRFRLRSPWCPGPGSNRHLKGFKPLASARLGYPDAGG